MGGCWNPVLTSHADCVWALPLLLKLLQRLSVGVCVSKAKLHYGQTYLLGTEGNYVTSLTVCSDGFLLFGTSPDFLTFNRGPFCFPTKVLGFLILYFIASHRSEELLNTLVLD